MRVRSLAALICQRIARLLSFAVSVLGLLSLAWTDLRPDTVVVDLFFILPVLSFPVTLLSFRWLRWSAALQWVLALGYLATYSLLDWRTCAELGYCEGVLPVVLTTLTSWQVQILFAVAIVNLPLLWLNRKPRPVVEEESQREAGNTLA